MSSCPVAHGAKEGEREAGGCPVDHGRKVEPFEGGGDKELNPYNLVSAEQLVPGPFFGRNSQNIFHTYQVSL